MTTEDNDKVETGPQNEFPREGLGERLRRARDAAGMSEAEAARELRMTVSKVRALEAVDFDRLPSDTFVRGYLKSYAKLLDENEQEILAAYRQARLDAGLSEAEEESPLQINLPAPRRSPWPLILVLLSVLVVLWLAAAWLADDGDILPEPDAAPASEQSASPQPDGDSQPAGTNGQGTTPSEDRAALRDNETALGGGESVLSGQETALSGQETALSGEETALSGEETALSGDETTPGDNEGLASANETTESATDATDAPDSNAEEARPNGSETAMNGDRETATDRAGPQAASSEPAADSGDLDQLQLSFADECWVEVVDDRGDVLQADLLRAGRELDLAGRAPFTVRLGNAEAVSVALNGEPFEFVPPAGERVVTLTVE